MVSFRPSALTSATTRLAPYCASATLAARPSPLPPPTTTTLRPSSRNSDVKSIESDIFFFLPESCTVRSAYVGMTRDWATRSAPPPLLPWSGRRGGGAAQNLDDGGVVGASEAGAAAGKVELLSCAGKRGGVGLRAGRFGDQTHVLDENVNRGTDVVVRIVDHPGAAVVEHERCGRAVPKHFPGLTGVQAERLGVGKRLRGDRDMHPAQQLIDEFDLLPSPGFGTDDGGVAGHHVKQGLHRGERGLRATDHDQQITLPGPGGTPGHGRVDDLHAGNGQAPCPVLDGCWSDGGHQ